MEVINSNKILHHMDRIVNNQKPITADIFLNNYCNNNCGFCTYKRWEFDEDARYMPFDDFVQYAKRLKQLGVLGFILSGGGEPTISGDFDRITAWLDDNGYKYGINTNFNRYVECNPEYLKVSLDAWDDDSYEKIRGVRSYKTVRENIVKFAKFKSDKTKLGIQLIAKSAESINRFYNANADLPVDYIVIRPVESTNGSYYKDYPGSTECHLEAIFETMEELQKFDGRVIKNFKWSMLDNKFEKCEGQWSQIAINELGEVMYCCHKPYQIIGHIMDEGILEKKKLAITDMSMCDIPCRLSSANEILRIANIPTVNAEFI